MLNGEVFNVYDNLVDFKIIRLDQMPKFMNVASKFYDLSYGKNLSDMFIGSILFGNIFLPLRKLQMHLEEIWLCQRQRNIYEKKKQLMWMAKKNISLYHRYYLRMT
jgi:hypothetical protein